MLTTVKLNMTDPKPTMASTADRVPRHLCSPDLAKIQAAVDAAHGALVIDGVHVEVDVATTSRATRRG